MSALTDRIVAYKQAHPGASQREIAGAIGCSSTAVWKALNPEAAREKQRCDNARRAPKKRMWDNAMRATCSRCGGPRKAGSLRADGSTRVKQDLCKTCRGDDRADRAMQMLKLRRDGLSNREIAEQVGAAPSRVVTTLSRLRALGFDVPVDPYFRSRQPQATVVTKEARHLRNTLAARGLLPDNEQVAA